MQRFSLVIGGLMRAVQARSGSRVMTDAMIMLLSRRVLAISHLVRVLALAIQTGTLRTRRSPPPGGTRRPATPQAVVLPRSYAWLVRLMGSDAATAGLQLQVLLEDPEMAGLLAASPRLVRTLRPLCRMLAVQMPAAPPPPAPPPAPGASTRRMTHGGAAPVARGRVAGVTSSGTSRRSHGTTGMRAREGGARENQAGGPTPFPRPNRSG